MCASIDKSNPVWLTYDNESGKALCNFRPEILACVDMFINDEETSENYVRMRLVFADNQKSSDFLEPVSSLEQILWHEKDSRCLINHGCADRTVRKYLANLVRMALTSATREKQYLIKRLGTIIIGGEPVFCTGRGLIKPPACKNNNITISSTDLPCSLDVDANLSEATAAALVLELVSLSRNAGLIILTHVLMYIMRAAYESAWIAPRCNVFLFGEPNIGKTSYSKLLVQIYDRGKGLEDAPRLNSSSSALTTILSSKNDCVLLLDDLYLAQDSEVRRKQEKTYFDITRIIGDSIGPIRKDGKKVVTVNPKCGALFTGEYYKGSGSDATRVLPVKMTQPNFERLKYFQDNRLIVSTFYYYFIEWFISNYYAIQNLLKEWHNKYVTITNDFSNRLWETHYYFNSTFVVFLNYCNEKNILSKNEAQTLHHEFQQLLTKLVLAQQGRVKSNDADTFESTDYLTQIRSLFARGAWSLSENAEQFTDELDGLIHSDCLCLRRDAIKLHFPKSDIRIILDGLKSQEALRNPSIQIYGTGGKHFVAIPLSKLK